MKITGLILAAAMALSSPAFAQAQQQAPATSAAEAPQSMQSVVVTARRFHVEPQQFMNYEYAYNLSNGETVRFSRRVGRFYVALKGYSPVEILPAAADQFVTKTGATLRFTEGGDALTIDSYELLQAESGLPLTYAFSASK
jgi:predicted lipid-binding transport protein (Tim44 family)